MWLRHLPKNEEKASGSAIGIKQYFQASNLVSLSQIDRQTEPSLFMLST